MNADSRRSDATVLARATEESLLALLYTELIQLGGENVWSLSRAQRARKLDWCVKITQELRSRNAQLRLLGG